MREREEKDAAAAYERRSTRPAWRKRSRLRRSAAHVRNSSRCSEQQKYARAASPSVSSSLVLGGGGDKVDELEEPPLFVVPIVAASRDDGDKLEVAGLSVVSLLVAS